MHGSFEFLLRMESLLPVYTDYTVSRYHLLPELQMCIIIITSVSLCDNVNYCYSHSKNKIWRRRALSCTAVPLLLSVRTLSYIVGWINLNCCKSFKSWKQMQTLQYTWQFHEHVYTKQWHSQTPMVDWAIYRSDQANFLYNTVSMWLMWEFL